MSKLHKEFGPFVYRAEIEKSIDRKVMELKFEEILERFVWAPMIDGILHDIYDDVTDHPEKWAEAYGTVTA